MTFKDLAVGDRFLFLGDRDQNRRRPFAESTILYRVKTAAREHTTHYEDGDYSLGLVGVGDNPVEPLAPGRTTRGAS